MSPNVPVDNPRPEVLIVGAGIGGLFLAILLKQINIPYHIFERASEALYPDSNIIRQMGSAMSLNGCTFPALDQLGIYEELKKVSKHYPEVEFYNASSKKLGSFTTNDLKIATGYVNQVFSRPKFYNILRNRIPEEDISFKKKVLSTEEKEGKVIIHFSDNTSYSGDILVGADGAYSAVRQNMYKQMNAKGILPESDLEDFLINYITMVGVATPPNPEQYPQLKDENSRFNQIIFGDGNPTSWGFGIQLTETDVKHLKSQNAEWSPEGNDTTLSKYKDFPCPLGGTTGDLFDATPKYLISKLHPAAGLGARNAIEDAISLANCLYFMKNSSKKSIESAFEDYYNHRYNHADEAFKISNFTSTILDGQRLLRHIALNYIPDWLIQYQTNIASAYRQQIAWLPLVENRGKAPMLPQEFEDVSTSKAASV
ncbi:hypothetical protein BGZ49_010873 [Haplosporangium sp. Z 27]|nr:hypothetical protein BGZ49_010873 [Haplosporangium sp. Z 27]